MKNHFLLDDGRDAKTQEKEWEELANLVRRESYKQLSALKNTITATSVAARLSKSPIVTQKPATKENRVFSSRPTLREMMHQYNARPAATTAPIRSPNAGPKARTGQGFQSDRIEHYQVPGLKGRILRPAR